MSKIKMSEVPGSSNVTHSGYDADTKTLAVTFKSGQTYLYHGVPASKYEALLAADSFGKHLNKHIIGTHAHQLSSHGK